MTGDGEGSRTTGMCSVGQDLGSSGLGGVGFERRGTVGIETELAAGRLDGAQLRYSDGRTMWPETDSESGTMAHLCGSNEADSAMRFEVLALSENHRRT